MTELGLSTRDGVLYAGEHKVLKAWESMTGWFWFAVEKVCDQMSDMGDGKPDGTPDTIWYGLVQGLEEEWGEFSEAEIKSLGNMAWPIPQANLQFSGRRDRS